MDSERQRRWRKKRIVTAIAKLLKSQKKDFTNMALIVIEHWHPSPCVCI